MSSPATAPAPVEGSYRCAECGHGRHLTAWGLASVHGPLGPDGDIAEIAWDEVFELFEDSIQCSQHPAFDLHKFIDGRWCQWVNCPRCHGHGNFTIKDGLRDYTKQCPEDAFTDVYGRPVHGGWWPLGQDPPAFTLERRGGHWLTPGGNPECRICGTLSGSINSGKPCPGKGHQCPAPVAEGDSSTAAQVYGHEGWICFQPGILNEAATEWRCGRGHVITSGHVPAGRAHDDVCAWPSKCPWRFLVPAGEQQ